MEAEGTASSALFDDFLEAYKGAAADEEDVGSIDGGKFLMGMLATTLGRNVRNSAFQDFEQRLLDAFTGDVASDRRVFVFLGDLIDFVDVDDALLGFLDVAVGGLKQF